VIGQFQSSVHPHEIHRMRRDGAVKLTTADWLLDTTQLYRPHIGERDPIEARYAQT
jgi:hypothetical protein